MARLEELKRGVTVKGILTDGFITVVDVSWIGSVAIELTYKDSKGKLANELIYRDREGDLEILESGKPWSFDGEADLFRLVSEAHRIRLAYLFDPLLAVHTSLVDPLPHQITAVYESMLPRQPLRFLLADDPGAGKTIMTGLLIKELIARGDLQRCLIVCPGNLVEQWQDELYRRFHLPFEIMTNDKYEAARTGNWFTENPLSICRLDKLSRNEDVQEKLKTTDWDVVVCDEAHKMSASFWGGEIRRTKRYKLEQLLSTLTRHFLLLTATPHNGKEEDFQLFMALVDGDRFEGKFRDGVHSVNASDLMRRMIKEDLLKFNGRPLFPERKAYTVEYELSDGEADLYQRVTEYVREEFNRAEQLANDGRRGTIGFALTVLQRRLASSPEAIYQSLRRRKERLEKRCREEELLKRGAEVHIGWQMDVPAMSEDDLEDLEDAPDEEVEDTEERVVDLASAAQTIAELKAEIEILKDLAQVALRIRQSRSDRKWEELSRLLQNQTEMFDAHGHRRKLIIFTEHRDTLSYLQERIGSLIGKPEAVVTIHGGMGREERKKSETLFTQDKDTEVLLATDAAGEGINLQRAHLMVNYDLPWNPNRLEQRFGRIHRIGQTEVCHCWNLVASKTREGDVYRRLLEKLDEERNALGGKVFDILGKLTFDDKLIQEMEQPGWLRDEIEKRTLGYAVQSLVPNHLQEVKSYKEKLVKKTMAAVKERLTVEINHWDHRAEQLKQQELAGKVNAKINSGKARQRADDLTSRLQKRMEDLQQERQISPLPPNIIGGAMIVPIGLLNKLTGSSTTPVLQAKETKRVEMIAMKSVMDIERELGFIPRNVSADRCGYDVESRDPNGNARLRFIEVKGRVQGADTVTITKNEILTALNKPEQFILAVVEVDGEEVAKITYMREPFGREPDFGVTSVNYKLAELLAKGGIPC